MKRSKSAITLLVLACVLAGIVGCRTTPGTTPGGSTKEPAKSPTTEDGAGTAAQPTIAEAEVAVRAIAREKYPDFEIESVSVVGMGRDSAGRWWVQAWTEPVGEGLESEQWFVTWDGKDWEYVDSGTGMERTDYPDVLEWKDVP